MNNRVFAFAVKFSLVLSFLSCFSTIGLAQSNQLVCDVALTNPDERQVLKIASSLIVFIRDRFDSMADQADSEEGSDQ